MSYPRNHNGGPQIYENNGEDYEAGGASNWFAVSRETFNHPIVGIHGRPYTDFEAWLSLIAMAAYAPRKVPNKGTTVVIDPGQLMAAHGFLAERWLWSVDKVRYFLKRLENEAMITRFTNEQPRNRTNQIQIITVCNYSVYQKSHRQPTPSESQASTKPTPSEHQANTKNLTSIQGNKVEESCPNPATAVSDAMATAPEPRKKSSYPAGFEQFWAGYPDKTNNSKAMAFVAWQRLSADDRSAVIASLAAYTAYCRAHPDYRPLHAERYLKQRRFEAYSADQEMTGWWQDPEKVKAITPDRWRRAIDAHANGVWPTAMLGPPPGHKGCVVPQEVIIEDRLTEIYDATGMKRSVAHQ